MIPAATMSWADNKNQMSLNISFTNNILFWITQSVEERHLPSLNFYHWFFLSQVLYHAHIVQNVDIYIFFLRESGWMEFVEPNIILFKECDLFFLGFNDPSVRTSKDTEPISPSLFYLALTLSFSSFLHLAFELSDASSLLLSLNLHQMLKNYLGYCAVRNSE